MRPLVRSAEPIAPAPRDAPRVPPGLVPRPRLLRVLARTDALPLVLLVAPAGYGKTALLAEWAARDRRSFSWLAPEELGDRRAAADLLERLACDAPAVIVVDDAQRAAPASLAGLADAVPRLPPGSALALASRRRLGGAIRRLEAHRLAVALGRSDLAMTGLEATMLLDAAGVALDADDLERAEGWPAALWLSALAERRLAEYLRDEVLGDLAERERAFLRRSSILDRLDRPLCDAVVGDADVLEDLVDGIVEPLPDGAFRCHPLLRAALREELEHREPQLVPVLHRRAATWHRRHRAPAAAIGHAIATDDSAYAGRLLWPAAAAGAAEGRTEAPARWLAAFDPADVHATPELAMAAAAVDLAEGRRDDARRWIAAADEAARRTARGPARTAAVALLRACLGDEGIDRMGQDAARAAELMTVTAPWHGLASALRGVAAHLSGDRDAALVLLRGAVRAAPSSAIGRAQLALLHAEAEDWDSAAEHAGDPPSGPLAARLLALTARAVVASRTGTPDDARRDAAAARALLHPQDAVPPWLAVEARIWLARASLRLTDGETAHALLAGAARIDAGAPVLDAWRDDAWGRADAFAAGRNPLTNAELRLVRLLPSHLTFGEIGARLHVSRNTVKTQALSAYRKLDVRCRSDAVARARAAGLIDR
jgi:LuxR family maltose regulon positive regulatory protein